MTKLGVAGMECPNCVRHVERGLRNVPGVVDAVVSLVERSATVTHSPEVSAAELLLAVEEEGYEATVVV